MLTVPHKILMKCEPLGGNTWGGSLTPTEIMELYRLGFREASYDNYYYNLAFERKKKGISNPIFFMFIWEGAAYERGEMPSWSR